MSGKTHWIVLALGALVGCASGGGAWREVATPHFVVRTDHDAKTARQIATALESDRDLIVSAAWPKTEIPEWAPTEVYVLADRVEFEGYFGTDVGSASLGSAPPQYFLHGSPGEWESRRNLKVAGISDLRFHVASRIATLVYPEAPPWFTHGVATFLETVHPSDDGRSVVMGAVNVSALDLYRGYRLITVERLLGWKSGDEVSLADSKGLGGLSWLFVHWLLNTRSEAFGRYRADLGRGTSAQAAFATAFPGFDPRAADEELNRYSNHGDYSELAVPLRSSEPTLAEGLLDPADVHVVRAKLINGGHIMNPGKTTAAASTAAVHMEVEQALALDAGNVAALWLADWMPVADRLSGARRAVAAHQQDGRAWELLGNLLRDTRASAREQEAAYRKASALAPHNPDTLNSLACALLDLDRAADALPVAIRAQRAAPQQPYILETYAAAMFGTGHCSAALSASERAVELSSSAADRADAEGRLAKYRSGCAPSPAARRVRASRR